MDSVEFHPCLQHPFNLICSAASQGGKTFWVRKLLLEKKIEPWPERIVWVYCYASSVCPSLKHKMPHIEYFDHIPHNIMDEDFTDPSKPTLIILDDQMQNLNEDVMSLFTRGTHHLNRSVILTVQNVFYQSVFMRTISLNAHYLVLWKQPRDMAQIAALGNQMYPQKSKQFLDAYKKATIAPYGYLFIDLRPTTDDRLRLRTAVLGEMEDSFQRVFLIENNKLEVKVLKPVMSFSKNLKSKSCSDCDPID